MRTYEISSHLEKTMKKLFKKDKKTYERLLRKINEIIKSFSVEHYKNLRNPLQDLKRIHIKEKVLVFKYNKKQNKILFLDFDHHDKIYLKKFT